MKKIILFRMVHKILAQKVSRPYRWRYFWPSSKHSHRIVTLNGECDISLKFSFYSLLAFLERNGPKKCSAHATYLLYIFKTGENAENANYFHCKVSIGWTQPSLPSCGHLPTVISGTQLGQEKQIPLKYLFPFVASNHNDQNL
jgi:hypothetical protein